jgi:hypothetical protein
MVKIETILTIHKCDTSLRKYLFGLCVISIKQQGIDMNLRLIYDKQTPQECIDLCKRSGFSIELFPEDTIEQNITNKLEWAYNNSTADIVFIIQDDDIWTVMKAKEQLQVMKADVSCVTCNSLRVFNKPEGTIFYLYTMFPHRDKRLYFADSLPSTWCLNKRLMPKFPLLKRGNLEWDILSSSLFFKYGHVVSLNDGLVIYNVHDSNAYTNAIREPNVDFDTIYKNDIESMNKNKFLVFNTNTFYGK